MSQNTHTLDVRTTSIFIFKSRKWPLKLLAVALCLLFFWLLLIPALLYLGYMVATARAARGGADTLPSWRGLGRKLLDGLLLGLVLFVWTLPTTASSLLAPVPLLAPPLHYFHGSLPASPLSGIRLLGLVWAIYFVLLSPAIWSQYLKGGLTAAFNLKELFRRVGSHVGLTVLVALLGMILAFVGFAGFAAAGIGALVTLPVTALMLANLYGQYARLTDPAAVRGPTGSTIGRFFGSIWRRFSTQVMVLLVVLVCASSLFVYVPRAASAGPAHPSESANVTIDFEKLPANGPGGASVMVSNQYADQGITFNNPTALDYGPNFAHSGTKAIEQCYGVEFCTTPIEMTFAVPHNFVRVWVGYSVPLSSAQTVVLTGRDSGNNQVAVATATLNPSSRPQPIRIPLEADSANTNIVRAAVNFSPSTLETNFLAVDDVEYYTPGIPSCSASGSPNSGPAPLAVGFQASVTQGTPPYTYAWDFGDGTTASGATVSHTYARPGSYSAILTVQDGAGKVCTQTVAIQASSEGDRTPPVVHILTPTDGQTLSPGSQPPGVDDLGAFHLSGYVIEDGSLAILELRVKRLDNNTVSTSRLAFGNPTPNFDFDDQTACCLAIGQNQITVRATDGAGNVGEASIMVVRQNLERDITIAGIEVTQAVQYFDSIDQDCLNIEQVCTWDDSSTSLPLIQGKDTVVRVYPKVLSSSEIVDSVSAILRVRDGNTLLATLQPMDTAGSVAKISITPRTSPCGSLQDMRRHLHCSWNFLLPAAMTNNRIHLTLDVTVNPLGSGHVPEQLCSHCFNNNHVRVIVMFHTPKTITIRLVRIDVAEPNGSVLRVTDEEVAQMERYMRQVFPMRIDFLDGGSHGFNDGELRGDLASPLGITGPFLKQERFSFTGGVIGSIIGIFYPRGGQAVDQGISIAECYATPEPDYYTLGLSPINDDHAGGLGFPPVHFYLDLWITQIDLATLGCNEAWANIHDPHFTRPLYNDGPGGAAQEDSHNRQVGPGHFSCAHDEQDLGIWSVIGTIVLKIAAFLIAGPFGLLLSFDLPIRAECQLPPQNAHGSIGEFGLDLTGDRPGYAGQWRVVNPVNPDGTHTHDFMSYGDDYWVSPLTYDREFESNP